MDLFKAVGAVICAILLFLLVKTVTLGVVSRLFTVRLRGKNIFITGCDTGIGRLLALKLATEHEAKVYAGCLTTDGAETLAKESKGRICALPLDITKDDSVESAYERVKEELGGAPLFALVNNAGLSRGWFVEFTPIECFEKTLEVNFIGTVRVTQRFLPLLIAGKGRLVTITTSLTLVANAGSGAYSSSKYALHYFLDILRKEVTQFGVQFVEICPGLTVTPFVEGVTSSASACFESADARVRERYGGVAFINRFRTLFNSTIVKLLRGKPSSVVTVLLLALSSVFPRRRYLVGLDAFFTWRVLGLLPATAQDYLSRLTGITTQA
ncbi:hypothetical protein BSKO_00503 [Bryopsis sp. KO-2023]|nr:hypothetical protein BSKO_00503 [Bryopsis sp. KO-2023]